MPYQDDQLNKTLARHENTDSARLAPEQTVRTCSKSATSDLCNKSDGNDTNHVSPSNAIVEQTQVGVEPRKGEVKRQEDGRDQILNLFCDLDGETTLVRADQTGDEGAKNGVDTDDASEECTAKSDEKGESNDTLGRAVFEGSGPAQNPHEGRADGVNDEENEADRR